MDLFDDAAPAPVTFKKKGKKGAASANPAPSSGAALASLSFDTVDDAAADVPFSSALSSSGSASRRTAGEEKHLTSLDRRRAFARARAQARSGAADKEGDDQLEPDAVEGGQEHGLGGPRYTAADLAALEAETRALAPPTETAGQGEGVFPPADATTAVADDEGSGEGPSASMRVVTADELEIMEARGQITLGAPVAMTDADTDDPGDIDSESAARRARISAILGDDSHTDSGAPSKGQSKGEDLPSDAELAAMAAAARKQRAAARAAAGVAGDAGNSTFSHGPGSGTGKVGAGLGAVYQTAEERGVVFLSRNAAHSHFGAHSHSGAHGHPDDTPWRARRDRHDASYGGELDDDDDDDGDDGDGHREARRRGRNNDDDDAAPAMSLSSGSDDDDDGDGGIGKKLRARAGSSGLVRAADAVPPWAAAAAGGTIAAPISLDDDDDGGNVNSKHRGRMGDNNNGSSSEDLDPLGPLPAAHSHSAHSHPQTAQQRRVASALARAHAEDSAAAEARVAARQKQAKKELLYGHVSGNNDDEEDDAGAAWQQAVLARAGLGGLTSSSSSSSSSAAAAKGGIFANTSALSATGSSNSVPVVQSSTAEGTLQKKKSVSMFSRRADEFSSASAKPAPHSASAASSSSSSSVGAADISTAQGAASVALSGIASAAAALRARAQASAASASATRARADAAAADVASLEVSLAALSIASDRAAAASEARASDADVVSRLRALIAATGPATAAAERALARVRRAAAAVGEGRAREEWGDAVAAAWGEGWEAAAAALTSRAAFASKGASSKGKVPTSTTIADALADAAFDPAHSFSASSSSSSSSSSGSGSGGELASGSALLSHAFAAAALGRGPRRRRRTERERLRAGSKYTGVEGVIDAALTHGSSQSAPAAAFAGAGTLCGAFPALDVLSVPPASAAPGGNKVKPLALPVGAAAVAGADGWRAGPVSVSVVVDSQACDGDFAFTAERLGSLPDDERHHLPPPARKNSSFASHEDRYSSSDSTAGYYAQTAAGITSSVLAREKAACILTLRTALADADPSLSLPLLITHLRQWRASSPASYQASRAPAALPGLVAGLVRREIALWDPLEKPQLDSLSWYSLLFEFTDPDTASADATAAAAAAAAGGGAAATAAAAVAASVRATRDSEELLPIIVAGVAAHRVAEALACEWDPLRDGAGLADLGSSVESAVSSRTKAIGGNEGSVRGKRALDAPPPSNEGSARMPGSSPAAYPPIPCDGRRHTPHALACAQDVVLHCLSRDTDTLYFRCARRSPAATSSAMRAPLLTSSPGDLAVALVAAAAAVRLWAAVAALVGGSGTSDDVSAPGEDVSTLDGVMRRFAAGAGESAWARVCLLSPTHPQALVDAEEAAADAGAGLPWSYTHVATRSGGEQEEEETRAVLLPWTPVPPCPSKSGIYLFTSKGVTPSKGSSSSKGWTDAQWALARGRAARAHRLSRTIVQWRHMFALVDESAPIPSSAPYYRGGVWALPEHAHTTAQALVRLLLTEVALPFLVAATEHYFALSQPSSQSSQGAVEEEWAVDEDPCARALRADAFSWRVSPGYARTVVVAHCAAIKSALPPDWAEVGAAVPGAGVAEGAPGEVKVSAMTRLAACLAGVVDAAAAATADAGNEAAPGTSGVDRALKQMLFVVRNDIDPPRFDF